MTETIENPALFEAIIVCAMQQIRAADKKTKFQELILVFQKAYGYAIKLNPPQVDEKFYPMDPPGNSVKSQKLSGLITTQQESTPSNSRCKFLTFVADSLK